MAEYCQRPGLFLGILGIYSVILTKRAWFHKGLIILSNLTRTFSWGTNAGNPERATYLALLGSQSVHIISSCPLADSSIYIYIIRTLKSLSSVHAPAGKFDCISLCVHYLHNEYLLNNNNASRVHGTITAINFKFVFRLCLNVFD